MNSRLWALRGCALLLVVAVGAGLSSCKTKDTTAPENVTSLAAAAGDGQVTLSWVNPADADLAGVRIQRKTDVYPAFGTDGDTVSEAATSPFTDTGLTNGRHYY